MTKRNKISKTTVNAIIIGIILVLSFSLMYAFKSDFPYALASGAIGAILTIAVTMLLLNKQSETEESKEKNSKIFEKKLDVYHEFIRSLETIIQDRKITIGEDGEKDELASLLFQLAQVRMHGKNALNIQCAPVQIDHL
ncbi:MAG: hypothetical protein WCM76_14800, partial [Bacteroidota bacterium]